MPLTEPPPRCEIVDSPGGMLVNVFAWILHQYPSRSYVIPKHGSPYVTHADAHWTMEVDPPYPDDELE
eukprot:gene8206-1701_t